MVLTKAKGITVAEIQQLIAVVGMLHFDDNLRMDNPRQRNANSVAFTIRCHSSRAPGARLSWTGRRTVAATWEAHRLVMIELFKRYPKATLKTALITYRGQADFDARHRGTWGKNAGSMMCPVAFGSL